MLLVKVSVLPGAMRILGVGCVNCPIEDSQSSCRRTMYLYRLPIGIGSSLQHHTAHPWDPPTTVDINADFPASKALPTFVSFFSLRPPPPPLLVCLFGVRPGSDSIPGGGQAGGPSGGQTFGMTCITSSGIPTLCFTLRGITNDPWLGQDLRHGNEFRVLVS